MSENKTKPTSASVTDFVNGIEPKQRRADVKKVAAMMRRATGKRARMWGSSIVGYDQYHYKYASGREGDFMLVGFSPRKANLVLYVLGSLDPKDPLLAKLGKFKRGRSCLYVNKLDDVNLGVLEKVIVKSYKNTRTYWAKRAG